MYGAVVTLNRTNLQVKHSILYYPFSLFQTNFKPKNLPSPLRQFFFPLKATISNKFRNGNRIQSVYFCCLNDVHFSQCCQQTQFINSSSNMRFLELNFYENAYLRSYWWTKPAGSTEKSGRHLRPLTVSPSVGITVFHPKSLEIM